MKRTKYPKSDITCNMQLIKKIAWTFHTSTGLELDDLIAQGYLIYLEKLKNWDPARGKITTFMWHSLHSNLINYANSQRKHYHPSKADPDYDIVKEKKYYFEDINEEGHTIAKIVLSRPSTFDLAKKENVEKKLYNILERRGWSKDKIQSGLDSLQTAFS